MIAIPPDIEFDEGELTFSFIRASGPGGQNVNKVSSAVQMRFDARRSPSLGRRGEHAAAEARGVSPDPGWRDRHHSEPVPGPRA